MFPLSDQIARCFRAMKDSGFLPSLFVTRTGIPPPGVHRAIHTPIMGREMATLCDFVEKGGDTEEVNMVEWDWERESGVTPEVSRENTKTPEVVRDAAR